MSEKPKTASGYAPEMVELVRGACLYLATKLGDLMEEIVVVGGLVPSLLIDQANLPHDTDPHAGTMDLDLGLAFALVNEERYTEVVERLASAGFEPDTNREGNKTQQRWRIRVPRITVDFLIDPRSDDPKQAGKLFHLSEDWAAIIAPGLHLAFRNFKTITLDEKTIFGERARRDIRVCGAGAFTILKALAFHYRGENKDAYDLFYLLRNYGSSPNDVAMEIQSLLDDPITGQALSFLKDDFTSIDSIGPMRTAEFLMGQPDEAIQADAHGYVDSLLSLLRE
ncbi:hypothetical protein [Cerasicoccus fimbriatus]|uniref:hypothetical protein n=1 Tax=Cerasicoccus fimbriatus TaxID=3014554 RepID=UPI0022B47FAF|nr:hypothetical protein [Cerasicoccus sp. TK19100]